MIWITCYTVTHMKFNHVPGFHIYDIKAIEMIAHFEVHYHDIRLILNEPEILIVEPHSLMEQLWSNLSPWINLTGPRKRYRQ
jgi:hypothetical protein